MIEKLFENRITEKTQLKKMDFLYEMYKVPCFPRGELVAVAGKAKSGKTSFLSMLMAMGVKPINGHTDFTDTTDILKPHTDVFKPHTDGTDYTDMREFEKFEGLSHTDSTDTTDNLKPHTDLTTSSSFSLGIAHTSMTLHSLGRRFTDTTDNLKAQTDSTDSTDTIDPTDVGGFEGSSQAKRTSSSARAQEFNPSEGKGTLPLRRAGDEPLDILWYDTEQSQQSTQEILIERIAKMAGEANVDDHVFAFNVRTFGWDERLKMFQEAIPYLEPDLVVLDGVRDLIADINDGREAQLITEQLMTLAQKHWCCIVCVLHQNKSDSDHNLRGWIGTELTNKVFEVYCCEKLKDNSLKVEQERTRKYDIGRELYYRIDATTQLPVATERSACDQPRDAKGRWVSQSPCTDVRKLFAIAMEGRMQRPKRELMAVAMKKCGVADAKSYYDCFNAAERQGVIRQMVHPSTGEEWVVLADTPLLF